MSDLNLPPFPFKIRSSGQSKEIFDLLRRRYVALTPEEWVRQHFVQYMIRSKGYPAALIAVEMGLTINGLRKRADLVVYNSFGNPWMIVECKAPGIRLSEDTLYQAARYHSGLNVRFLTLTNGMEHYCCAIDGREIKFLEDLPDYGE